MRQPHIAAAALALGLMLSGCESFELPDMPDWFNPKKPLVGERKPIFPEGVPGVQKGVPAELQQGYQPPPEPPQTAEVVEKPKPKAKAKPKPKQAAAPPPSRAATSVTIQPVARQQQPANDPAFPQPPRSAAGSQSTWPTPQQTASQPAPAQSPFPDPPPPR
jgi:outer membrane biosynthesis protein TonB